MKPEEARVDSVEYADWSPYSALVLRDKDGSLRVRLQEALSRGEKLYILVRRSQ